MEEVIQVRLGEIVPEQIYPIRHTVLWPDKPVSFVKVEDDRNGWHFGVFENETLVSVISLFPDPDGSLVRFRKFATLPAFRGKGYGKKLLLFGMDHAAQRGFEKIWCDARADAIGFYEKLGFKKFSPVFVKEGLDYFKIEKKLPLNKRAADQ